MKIFLGADHAGFQLKERIKTHLAQHGHEFEDMGNVKYDARDDYPDYAKAVAEKVSKTKDSRGLLICGSGVGVCIVANKIKGIRAVNAFTVKVAKSSREDDDTNVLCFGADWADPRKIEKVLDVWMETAFNKAPRFKRREEKIRRIER